MLLLGIDEAGRGPVIGPMIIVGFALLEEKLEDLEEIGVRDSKELTKREREEIYEELTRVADKIVVKKLNPPIIDRYVYNKQLNLLELRTMAEIIQEVNPDKVYVDAPSRNLKKVEETILQFLRKDVDLVVENKADKKYSVVSAASIVAKVLRDREIDRIIEITGIDFGSGYPSDPKTKKALKEHYDSLKDFVRKSWKTVRSKEQKTIDKFLKL